MYSQTGKGGSPGGIRRGRHVGEKKKRERDERTGGFSFTLILLVDRKRAVLLEWLKGSSVYVASEIATVYLWASLREVELEFSPKGASNVRKENRDNACCVGLRARGEV